MSVASGSVIATPDLWDDELLGSRAQPAGQQMQALIRQVTLSSQHASVQAEQTKASVQTQFEQLRGQMQSQAEQLWMHVRVQEEQFRMQQAAQQEENLRFVAMHVELTQMLHRVVESSEECSSKRQTKPRKGLKERQRLKKQALVAHDAVERPQIDISAVADEGVDNSPTADWQLVPASSGSADGLAHTENQGHASENTQPCIPEPGASNLNMELQQATETVAALKSDVLLWSEAGPRCEAELLMTSETNAQLSQNVEIAETERDHMQLSLVALQKERQNMETTWKAELENTHEEVATVKAELTVAHDAITKLPTHEQVATLKAELNVAKEAITKLPTHEQVATLKAELLIASETNAQLSKNAQIAETERDHVHLSLVALQNERQNLETRWKAELENSHEEVATLKAELTVANDAITKLPTHEQVATLKAELDVAKDAITKTNKDALTKKDEHVAQAQTVGTRKWRLVDKRRC